VPEPPHIIYLMKFRASGENPENHLAELVKLYYGFGVQKWAKDPLSEQPPW